MTIFDVSTSAGRAAGLAAAEAALAAGRLVAIPTETVYGLAADATDGRAVAAIYAAKGRPRFNPLIAHVADRAAAEREGVFDARARALADAFWPGPLTLVLPRAPGASVADLVTAGLDTVALRMPANAVTRALIARFGRPLAAPSANRSGHVSPTAAADVAADLGDRVAVILDAGPAPVGVESTIVAVLADRVVQLRPGGVPRAAVAAVLGGPVAVAGPPADPMRPTAPGMLASHYAPRARLRLDAAEVRPGEAGLDFAGRLAAAGAAAGPLYRDLSPSGDLAEAAAGLFRALRDLDAAGAVVIAVAPVPGDGLGEAIVDRLGRAAAPRP
jgi:L-threonylcarbamoyladenylate synthase